MLQKPEVPVSPVTVKDTVVVTAVWLLTMVMFEN